MKHLVIISAAAITLLCGCKGGTPTANLKTDVDTLSYEMGLDNSNGLKMYLTERVGVDTAYIDEFIKGLNEGAQAGDDKKKAAYYAGIQIGQQIGTQMIKGANFELFGNDSTKTLSLKNYLAGFIAGVRGKGFAISREIAAREWQSRVERIKNVHLTKSYGKNKVAGEQFLANNAKQPGVKTLPGGVQYRVIKVGNGPIPADTTKVEVNYEGRTITGKVFDSSYKNNQGKPVEIRCNQVIKGWTQALTRMPQGSVWEIYIPQELAYGNRELSADIQPYSALIFKLELVKVNK